MDLQVQVVFPEAQDQKETLGPKDHLDRLGHQGHLESWEILEERGQQVHLVILVLQAVKDHWDHLVLEAI